MATPTRLNQLYKRLSSLGFSRPYLRKHVLPSTWRDELAEKETIYQNLLVFLSRHLSIRLAALEDSSVPLSFDNSRTRFFRGPEITDDAGPGLRVAEGVARLVLLGTPEVDNTTFPPAATIRRSILDAGRPWVDLQSLLNYCWQRGVPVVHVKNLPPTATKLRGVLVEVEKRAAIILCQQHRPPARHLTPLAHEMGHLAGDHLWFIGRGTGLEAEFIYNEKTEAQAHRYATELITGGQSIPPDSQKYRTIEALVAATYERSRAYKIDPGYLIRLRATSTNNYQEEGAALNIIEGERSASEIINSEAVKHVDWEHIPPSSREFFSNVTGTSLGHRNFPTYRPPARDPDSRTIALFRHWGEQAAMRAPKETARQLLEYDQVLDRLSRSRFSIESRTDLATLLGDSDTGGDG